MPKLEMCIDHEGNIQDQPQVDYGGPVEQQEMLNNLRQDPFFSEMADYIENDDEQYEEDDDLLNFGSELG